MDLIIGLVAIILVAYYIVKGYSATGVLMFGGLVLLLISVLMGHSILPENVKSTGSAYFDILEYVKYLLSNRSGGLGLMIMILCGFSAYMTHLGANDMVVKIVSMPLKNIRSPYILMVFAYFLACLMSFAVSSATGLGVLLMATLFPVMVNMGISRGAAAAICASPISIILSPTSGDVVLSAEISKQSLSEFAFSTSLPVSIVAICGIGTAHFFWQRYCDRREGLTQGAEQALETAEAAALKSDAPLYYFILPFLPIIGLFIYNGEILPEIKLGGLVVLTILITTLIEFLRSLDARKTYDGLEVCYRGMAEGFSGVVVLLVAAGIFAHGLETIGFVKALIDSVQGAGAANVVMLALVVITLVVAVAAGSGNAAFFAFVELAPRLAEQMNLNPGYLIAPMMQVSNTGRVISPVSGVMVAVSGAAKISPLLLVKRNAVPALVAVVVIVVYTMLFIPQ